MKNQQGDEYRVVFFEGHGYMVERKHAYGGGYSYSKFFESEQEAQERLLEQQQEDQASKKP